MILRHLCDYYKKCMELYPDEAPALGFEKRTLDELVPSKKLGLDTSGDISKKLQLLRFSLTAEEVERYQEIGKDASTCM